MHRKAKQYPYPYRLQREVATERCPGNRIGKGITRFLTKSRLENDSRSVEEERGELADNISFPILQVQSFALAKPRKEIASARRLEAIFE